MTDKKGSRVVKRFGKTTLSVASKMRTAFRNLSRRITRGLGGAFKFLKRQLFSLKGAAVIALAGWGLKKVMGEFAGFEAAMANVSTLVDTSKVSMAKLREEVMALPSELGSATENAKALYQALSAGIEPAKAVQFVGEAAKAAKAGLTDTFTAVDAGTTVLNAFGLQTQDATKIYDQMFKTVEQGKTTFGGLAGSVGRLSPIAAAAKVSTEEMFAALATLTKGGFATSEASSRMATALGAIIKPSSEASKLANKLGLDFSATALKAKGLAGFLDSVKVATGGDVEAMGQLFGGMESLSVMLALTGAQAGEFKDILEEIENSAGAVDTAFDKQKATLTALWATFKNTIGKQVIILGSELAPQIKGIIEDIEAWMEANKELIKGKIVEYAAALSEKIQWVREHWDELEGVLREVLTTTLAIAKAFYAVGKAIYWTNTKLDSLNKKLKGFVDALSFRAPKELLVKFTGEGSTKRPLGDKIQEMTGRMRDFASVVNNLDIKPTADFDQITKSIDLYKELYQATGYDEFANKAIEAYDKILDKDEAHWREILGNADDALTIRMLREADFVQSLCGTLDEVVGAERDTAGERIQITQDMADARVAIENNATRAIIANAADLAKRSSGGTVGGFGPDWQPVSGSLNVRVGKYTDMPVGPGSGGGGWLVNEATFGPAFPASGQGYQSGTGPQGLPRTGLFYGHKGEIVHSPAESEGERQGGTGNTYNITIAPQMMTGDRAAAREVAAEIREALRELDHRWN